MRISDGFAPNTVLRYITCLLSLFEICRNLHLDLHSLDDIGLADLLMTGVSEAGKFSSMTLKAIRWAWKQFALSCFHACFSSIVSTLLMDEIPAIEVSKDNMGINAIRTSMDLFNTALAMCNGAHLANLKEYTHKFVSMLTQRGSADTGLGAASVIEAQAADRQIWGTMAELVNERQWSFDQALHELTHVRSDLAVLLQLRPKVPKAIASSTSSFELAAQRRERQRQRHGETERQAVRERKNHNDHRISTS